MTTIYDVAKEVGCAPSTVSKFITKHGYVSRKMATKIATAMEKLDYHYNGLARNLSTQTNNRIGIMVPFLDHPYFQSLVNAISLAATQVNKEIVILPTAYDPQREEKYLHELEHNLLSSLIIASHTLPPEQIASYNRFGRIVFCEETTVKGVSYVSNNRLTVFEDVFRRLKQEYRSQIGILAIRQPALSKTSHQIFAAYQKVFGRRPNSTLVAYNCRTVADGRKAIRVFNHRTTDLQAVFAESDMSATGAYLEGRASNNHVMVIGQGNQLASQLLNFTSIDQRLDELGKQALRLALLTEDARAHVNPQIIWRQ